MSKDSGLSQHDLAVRDRLEAMGLPVAFVPSPNRNERPASADALVIHYTALDMDESLRHLSDPATQVSTHYVIDRDGRTVQLVPLGMRAWHAGVSRLEGRDDVNDFGVGIDLVFVPDRDPGYSEAQYRSLAALCRELLEVLGVPAERIVGHEHVALPPGRKQDPGPLFDWGHLFGLIAGIGGMGNRRSGRSRRNGEWEE